MNMCVCACIYMCFNVCVCVAGLICIKEMEEEGLRAADMPFSVPSATGLETQLSHKHSRITPDNRSEYVKMAINDR